MLFDQQVELVERRLHDIDVAEIAIHHLDQERGFTVCVSAPVSQHEASVRFVTRFAVALLAPFFSVLLSSAVPGYCRASALSLSQLRLSGFASPLGLLPPLAAPSAHRSHEARQRKLPVAVLLFSSDEGRRPVQPCNFVRHRHCPNGSNRRLTPERLVH